MTIEENAKEFIEINGSKEAAIESVEKLIKSLNNEFNIFGYTSEDLKRMKKLKETLNYLKNE